MKECTVVCVSVEQIKASFNLPQGTEFNFTMDGDKVSKLTTRTLLLENVYRYAEFDAKEVNEKVFDLARTLAKTKGCGSTVEYVTKAGELLGADVFVGGRIDWIDNRIEDVPGGDLKDQEREEPRYLEAL